MVRRRRLLLAAGATVGSVAVTGCIDNGGGSNNEDADAEVGDGVETLDQDSDDDGVPDNEDEYPNDPDRSQNESTSGRIEINEDEWYRWAYDFDFSTHIEYEMIVRDGPAVDVILFEENEYTYYENGERAKYFTTLSDLDTTRGIASGWVEQGSYRLVVDNTNYGEAQPPSNLDDDLAEVEYELTLSR